jgi:Mor family transcriptional regulator
MQRKRKIFKELTNKQKEQITVEFHLRTLSSMARKFNVSKTTIHLVVTDYFKKKRIDVTGLTVTEIMTKYNCTMSNALRLRMKFEQPMYGSVYFGQVKEAIYSNEDEMLIPSYSVKDLTGWEAEQL